METKSKVSQKNGQSKNNQSTQVDGYSSHLTIGENTNGNETGEEVIPEVKGNNDEETNFESIESGEETTINGHQSVNSPIQSTYSETDETVTYETSESEASSDESSYEFENYRSETESSGEEAEPLLEASFADAEASQGQQEFFGALAGLIAPLIPTIAKAVLPGLAKTAGGIAKTVAPKVAGTVGSLFNANLKKLNPQAQALLTSQQAKQLIGRLQGLGVKFKLEANEETGYENFGEENEEENESTANILKQLDALETIIGRDDRKRIHDTTAVPWKRICHLKIMTKTGKYFSGTGFFIDRRTIVTAGHCVFLHGHGGWAKQITVSPARNGDTTPFNSITARNFRSVQGWTKGKGREYDYGVILLSKTDVVSPNIGAFGFGRYSDQFLLKKKLNTAGYPGDKASGTMWYNGREAKSVTPQTIIYDADTMPGQSGSPVWFTDSNGAKIVVGIHTNGSISGNSATRISQPVLDNLKKWRKESNM